MYTLHDGDLSLRYFAKATKNLTDDDASSRKTSWSVFLPGPSAFHDLYMVLASAWSVEFTKIKSLPSSEQQLSIMDDDRL